MGSTHQHLEVVLSRRESDLFDTPSPCIRILAFPCLDVVNVDVALRVPPNDQIGLPGDAGD